MRMSRFGAAIRSTEQIRTAVKETEQELKTFEHIIQADGFSDLWRVFRLRDVLICQYVYLTAMLDYISHNGKSRGSALYTDRSGQKPDDRLPDKFTFCLDGGSLGGMIQEAELKNGRTEFWWRAVRPLPEDDDFFENVWREYRKNKNVW